MMKIFSLSDMPLDNILFICKFLFLGLIYLFLFQIIGVIRHDMRGSKKTVKGGADYRNSLEVLAGEEIIEGSRGSTIPLSPSLTFGRDPSSDIQIYDSTVSTHHSRITLEKNDYVIEDCGSKNGTFVNDERIDHPAILRKGDIIRIGMLTVKFLGEK